MSDQEKDPVVHSSLSKPLFISSALLVISMVWGLYDEMYGIRPWKGYQARFVKIYSRYLKTAAGGEAGASFGTLGTGAEGGSCAARFAG